MFANQRIVPQLVEQFNDLIEQNILQSLNGSQTDTQNNDSIGFSDQTIDNNLFINNVIKSDSQLFPNNEENSIQFVQQNEDKDINKSIELKENENEVLVEVNEVIDKPSERQTVKVNAEEKVVNEDKECKSDSIKAKIRTELIVIKVNPILEHLKQKRKHSFVTKTNVQKQNCIICCDSINFSEKYIQCVVCIAVSHMDCTSKIPVPCIPYTNPNLKPFKTISNYVYPAFKPSIPSILIHCCREIEERIHESSVKDLYVMKSEDLKQVKDLCDKIHKTRISFPILKDININLICGVVKKFLSDFNESLIGREMWKQFSHNMRKKDDEEMMALTKKLIMEMNVTNRDTLSFVILHLKNLVNIHKSLSLEVFAEVFCPIICGDTEVTRKMRLMSALLCLNNDFWIQILLK